MAMPVQCHYFGNVAQNWHAPVPGVIVPQIIWAGPAQGGGEVVSFYPGISLTQALQLGQGQGFDARTPTTNLNRARLTLRIQWPGYQSWSSNLNVRERNAQAEPIPLYRLARRIAECVRTFYNEMRDATFDPATGDRWHIGYIPFERLYLLELRQVSTGSWQPVLSYL